MPRGDVEYRRLVEAFTATDPACQDDWRYLIDANELDGGDLTEMRATCRQCPLADPCTAYAAVAKPTGGMWAGRHYAAPKGRTRKENA